MSQEVRISKHHLKKLPGHLSIILTDELVRHLNYVIYIIKWARLCGVRFVSIYDQQGNKFSVDIMG